MEARGMKVRYLSGPHKGKVVDMGTSAAQAGIAAKQLEAVVEKAERPVETHAKAEKPGRRRRE